MNKKYDFDVYVYNKARCKIYSYLCDNKKQIITKGKKR